jgi:hypothetical protein
VNAEPGVQIISTYAPKKGGTNPPGLDRASVVVYFLWASASLSSISLRAISASRMATVVFMTTG